MTSYMLITAADIAATAAQAATVARKRINHNYHDLADSVQRMLNAVEPDSYVRPHRHVTPPKTETFLIMQGRLAVLLFDDAGLITHTHILDGIVLKGIDIKPGLWHSIVALDSGTVVFEVKDGPYVPATDKDFASWAPPENTAAAQEYLQYMKKQIVE